MSNSLSQSIHQSSELPKQFLPDRHQKKTCRQIALSDQFLEPRLVARPSDDTQFGSKPQNRIYQLQVHIYS